MKNSKIIGLIIFSLALCGAFIPVQTFAMSVGAASGKARGPAAPNAISAPWRSAISRTMGSRSMRTLMNNHTLSGVLPGLGKFDVNNAVHSHNYVRVVAALEAAGQTPEALGTEGFQTAVNAAKSIPAVDFPTVSAMPGTLKITENMMTVATSAISVSRMTTGVEERTTDSPRFKYEP